ncbi:MAG: cytochrome c biogenesis protein ResB [Lachnospiraceae bacterium]|nr:cytochrome c biogenesis protein ResB [Lachnospiraceae bacterium]
MKKVLKFFVSMKFAIALLMVLAVFLALASFIPQNQDSLYYINHYGRDTASFLTAFGLTDVFRQWWFYAIAGVLCFDLILCNVNQIPGVVKRFRSADSLRKKIGSLGAVVTHFGILVLVVGFTLGQITKEEYTVYGLPGDVKEIGKTGMTLTIDSFDISMNEDDTVDQYTAGIRMTDQNGRTESGVVEVNAPGTLFGYRVYQNSFGWAAKISVSRDGVLIQEEYVIAGEKLTVADNQDLTVSFGAFYPDYYFAPRVGPSTRSSKMNDPRYLYGLEYRDEMLGAEILKEGEMITVDAYAITFSDPKYYTLLQVKKDSFTWIALIGALIVTAGLVFSFYFKGKSADSKSEEGETHVDRD